MKSTATVNRKDNQYMYISLHDDTLKMDITQKISVRMVFTIIASVIAANTVMEFGSIVQVKPSKYHQKKKQKCAIQTIQV